jgi:hypothetical protein
LVKINFSIFLPNFLLIFADWKVMLLSLGLEQWRGTAAAAGGGETGSCGLNAAHRVGLLVPAYIRSYTCDSRGKLNTQGALWLYDVGPTFAIS